MSDFLIEMISDLDFEGMVIEVSYKKEPIVSINYDKGIENIEISLLHREDDLTFSFTEFAQILEKAKKLALKCAKEDGL